MLILVFLLSLVIGLLAPFGLAVGLSCAFVAILLGLFLLTALHNDAWGGLMMLFFLFGGGALVGGWFGYAIGYLYHLKFAAGV